MLSKKTVLLLFVLPITSLMLFLILSFQSISKSVQSRLLEDSQNKAISIALLLNNTHKNSDAIANIISSNFEATAFSTITLSDKNKKHIYNKESKLLSEVPKWFSSLVDLKTKSASVEVLDLGTLEVQSSTIYAYKQLYAVFINLILSFIALSAASAGVIAYVLKKSSPQDTREEEPAAAKTVAKSMQKEQAAPTLQKAQIDEELVAYRELSYIDEDTSLKNRKYLIDKLPQYLKVDALHRGGTNILVALSGVIEANEKLGRQKVDKLFVKIANIFKEEAKNFSDSIVARINPTEFSLLLPQCNGENAVEIAKRMQQAIVNDIDLAGLNKNQTFVSMGIYEYSYSDTIAQLFARSDNALAQAKFSHTKIHLERSQTVAQVMGKEAWKMLINKAIEKQRFHFVSWSAIDTSAKKTVHNILSINLTLDKNSSYSYSQFMAPAIQVGRHIDVYKTVISMLFKNAHELLSGNTTYALRLPQAYLEDKDTYISLSELLREHMNTLPFSLIIELPDKLVHEDSKLIRMYRELFDEHNIKIGIFEFIGECEDFTYIQLFKPLYIKAESDYYLTQSDKALLTLESAAKKVNSSLIAVGVSDSTTLEQLKNRGIHIIQGSITDTL